MSHDYWTLYEAPPDSPKKWVVRVPSGSGRGREVAFGARGYEDFTTHHDVERRERYRTRHQRDRLDDPYAPGFWSMWALWGDSDDLDTAFADAVKRAKKILKKIGEPTMTRRRNPVREPFNFTHYEEYASRLTDAQLHHAIIDALNALKTARTWDDGGAGEAKYLDQISVMRREQKARGMRSNPSHFEQYEFRVSTSFLPALFNGDTSGLSAEDEAALDRFLKRVMKLGHGHWAVIEEGVGFGKDEITGLGSDRDLVAWMVPSARHNPRRPLREDWLEQAREAGRVDAANWGDKLAERRDYLAQAGWRSLDDEDRKALLKAWDEGAREVRHNPEWAKKMGRALGAPRRAKERATKALADSRERARLAAEEAARTAAETRAATKAAWDARKAKARAYYDEVRQDIVEGMRSNPRLSACAQQYLETALWSSSDEDGHPLDDQFDVSDFAPEAIQQAEKDCLDFLSTNDVGDLDEEQVGHNFWLTRNRHGAGFWDLGLGALGDRLTKAAHVYGECDVYLGDDGKLYLS
jgi:hypothetical protein